LTINRRAVLAAAASTALGTAVTRGDATIEVNPSVNHGTWEGRQIVRIN
jgi:hypothetical protein